MSGSIDGVAAVETERAASLLARQLGPCHRCNQRQAGALYLDGREVSGIDCQFAETGGALTVGASAEGDSFLTGQVDELTIANTARSPDWIKAQFANQGQDEKLVHYGEDTAEGIGRRAVLLPDHPAERDRRRLGRHRHSS